jgi:Flp pilus assembly pilin Flp
MKRLNMLIKAEDGATSVEYAIVSSLIAAVIVGIVNTLGVALTDLFSTLQW